MALDGNAYSKALTSNSNASAAFAAKNATTTQPTSQVVSISPTGAVPKFVDLMPYGSGTNNQTFDMQLWGWAKTTDATPIWIPKLLVQLACTMGNVTATDITGDTLICDTLSLTYGDSQAAIVSPANDFAASALVHIRGCYLLQWVFKVGTATNANCLYRFVDQK